MIDTEKLERIGSVDVDSGTIWVGDPCYVIKDKNESRPTDLGKDWYELTRTYFDRSGYTATENEYINWRETHMHQGHLNAIDRFKKKHGAGYPESDEELADYKRMVKEEVNRLFNENPYVGTKKDLNYANFKHDNSCEGLGVMMSTLHGDGSYGVFVERDESSGRIKKVVLDLG